MLRRTVASSAWSRALRASDHATSRSSERTLSVEVGPLPLEVRDQRTDGKVHEVELRGDGVDDLAQVRGRALFGGEEGLVQGARPFEDLAPMARLVEGRLLVAHRPVQERLGGRVQRRRQRRPLDRQLPAHPPDDRAPVSKQSLVRNEHPARPARPAFRVDDVPHPHHEGLRGTEAVPGLEGPRHLEGVSEGEQEGRPRRRSAPGRRSTSGPAGRCAGPSPRRRRRSRSPARARPGSPP